ncbi:GrpB family protein [Paenibacillus popilliae]|uniref:GrpB family protein n=1 Tax=Paenibacillus popilliae TaxID=78057 RepID=A0ABY3ATA6_PAEPP|nr:GrpB family protein [Paenibacillus sp. SDF0028]TQR45940.1 GrpB family protein [Paenibacillus sp. SDF0028]
MGSRPVIIEDYNDAWPVMFNELKNILGNKLGELALTIEHVGSTSVPGLSAKPILDIDIVIDSMTLLPQVIGKLSELGYFYEGNLGVENREAFARTDDIVPHNEEMNQKPKHHLYVCNKESEALKKHITFRDILRQHPDLVTAYSSLKIELAEKFTNNRTAYTDGKTHFVNTVLDEYKSIL